MTELRDHLAPHADTEADGFWWLVKIYAPFVHAPGKTAWSYGRRPLLVGAPAWLKERAFADEQAGLEHLVRRYLGAFGPASLADMSQWSGLTIARLRPAAERITDIEHYTDEGDRALIDLADAPLPEGEEEAPVRLLPMWDSSLLAYAKRDRMLPDEYRKVVIARNGDVLPTFLVDGLQMSNFVYPAWFEPFKHPRGTKYDHLGLLKAPFTMTKGGYVIVKRRGKVKERYGSKAKAKRFALEDRRGHRGEYRKPKGVGQLIKR